MRVKLNILGMILLGASSLFAQSNESWVPTLGIKVGVPVTDMFDASNTSLFNGNQNVPGSTYTSAIPRYELGVSGEFHLPYHLRFEVDGLYKRAGFATGNSFAYTNTSMNVFEVPALFKYDIAMGHFRPFIDFGASLRHIAGVRDNIASDDFSDLYLVKNDPALHNRNSYGAVAGFGITFKKGPFELTPEARYTRWANESFEITGLRTNLDQGDILLGISF